MGCREVHVLVPLTMQGLCQGCQYLNQLPSAPTVVITVYLKQARGRGEGEGEREKEIRKFIACNFTECTYIEMVSL